MTYVGAVRGLPESVSSELKWRTNSGRDRFFKLHPDGGSIFTIGKRNRAGKLYGSDAEKQYVSQWRFPADHELTPTSETNINNISQLSMGDKLQDWVNIIDPALMSYDPQGTTMDAGVNGINDIMPYYDGDTFKIAVLVGEGYDGNSGDGKERGFCTVIDDADDFANTTISGYYTTENAGAICGYAGRVPDSWKPDIGSDWVVGGSQQMWSRTERGSLGPSIVGFDPKTELSIAPTKMTRPTPSYAEYPGWETYGIYPWLVNGFTHALNPDLENTDLATAPDIFWHRFCNAQGIVLVPRTNTVLVFGYAGGLAKNTRSAYKNTFNLSEDPEHSEHPNAPDMPAIWIINSDDDFETEKARRVAEYGVDADDPRWVETGGWQASDLSDIETGIWFYRKSDLLDAKNGVVQPHEVRPYDFQFFTPRYCESQYQTPYVTAGDFKCVSGVDYDEANDRLILAIQHGGSDTPSTGSNPLYLVYKLNIPL